MITSESKFIEFIDLCLSNKACEDAMLWMNKQLELDKEQSFGDAIKAYLSDENIIQAWSEWNITAQGRDLDDKVRGFFISDITDPLVAMQVISKSTDLAVDERTSLESVYKGKITSDKEGIVVKYISAECYGKGFISPIDATNLKFENVGNTLWKVEGVEAVVDTWIAKVNGTLIEKATAASVRVG